MPVKTPTPNRTYTATLSNGRKIKVDAPNQARAGITVRDVLDHRGLDLKIISLN